jgi:hypothetical protein
MTDRPPILNKEGKLSDNVKARIIDRKGELCGLILADDNKSYIYLLDETSAVITFDKNTGKIEMAKEVFIKNPKELLSKVTQ